MSEIYPETPLGAAGYQGPMAHTHTPACAGHHPPSAPCSMPPLQPGFLDLGRPATTPGQPITAPDVIAGLLADVAERDERLAVQHEAMTQLRAGHSEALAAMTAKLDRALAANQRWAETLADVQQRHADVKRQRDDARSAFATLAGRFTQGAQSGWTARVSGTVLRRLCAMAMCEPPDGSDAPDEAGELAATPALEAP